MPKLRFYGIGQLGRRLALAFVMVALAGIAINVFYSQVSVGPEITRVVRQQQDSLAKAIMLTAGAAYQGIGWRHADLEPVNDMATSAGAGIQVRDNTGRLVRSSRHYRSLPPASERTSFVIVRGRRVGSVSVRFGSRGLGAIAGRFEAERLRASIAAAAVAAVLALVVSVLIARRITRPLDRMLEAARARAAGDRSARVEPVAGIGVVRELLGEFNHSTDVTDQQDRVLRNLIADVAHELRTPVAILQAGHEAMADGITEPTAENLSSLRDEVLRLARMVADLQALASAEAAALQMKLVPHDVSAIATDAASSLAESYELNGVALSQDVAPVFVNCDKSRMREIIVNLLTNALKFTPSGGAVFLRSGPAGRNQAQVVVSDDGVGIPDDELPLVAERFFRGQRSAEMAAGSGIGLTIVSELVEAHHGTLRINSELGAGTRVTLTFPRAADGVVASAGRGKQRG